MNRKIWTNQKRHLSTNNAEEQASPLCGKVENTMHLLFKCVHSALTFIGTSQRGNHCFDKTDSLITKTYQINAHSAIYNIYDGQVLWQHTGQVMAWLQEIKKGLNLPQI
jgi:hypothetical protein